MLKFRSPHNEDLNSCTSSHLEHITVLVGRSDVTEQTCFTSEKSAQQWAAPLPATAEKQILYNPPLTHLAEVLSS